MEETDLQLKECSQWSDAKKVAFCSNNWEIFSNYIKKYKLTDSHIIYVQNFCKVIGKNLYQDFDYFKRFHDLIQDKNLLALYVQHYKWNPNDCTGAPDSDYGLLPAFPHIVDCFTGKRMFKWRKCLEINKNYVHKLEWSLGGYAKKYSVLRHLILDDNNTSAFDFIIDAVVIKEIRRQLGKTFLDNGLKEYLPEISIEKNQKEFVNIFIKNVLHDKSNIYDLNRSNFKLFNISLALEYLGFDLKSPFFLVLDNNYKYVKAESEIIIHQAQLSDFRSQLISPEKMLKKITLNDIDLMTGKQFEIFISSMFHNMGYRTELTKSSGDQGVDILAYKNDVTIGIQTKCYSSKVGNSSIQEVVAGSNFYRVKTMMVITNNYFTQAAKTLAEANKVVLWDRDMLRIKLNENQ